MFSALRRSVTVGLVALSLSFLAYPAQANPVLPNLTNLNFLDYSGNDPKDAFTAVNPTGWTGGNGLIFVTSSGTSAADPATACGPTYLSTYGCPSTLAIAGGYNQVEADGNPVFASGFHYLVTGLTPGQTYDLSFYQAASQQRDFTGDTTEQWIVSLGTSGLTVCPGCGIFDVEFGSNQSTYANADPNASFAVTPLMHTPSGGMTDWNFVKVSLTADATENFLSFLAWGNNGTTANLPPMVFLTGVNSGPGLDVPEPATLGLLGTAVLAGIARARQRANRKNTPAV